MYENMKKKKWMKRNELFYGNGPIYIRLLCGFLVKQHWSCNGNDDNDHLALLKGYCLLVVYSRSNPCQAGRRPLFGKATTKRRANELAKASLSLSLSAGLSNQCPYLLNVIAGFRTSLDKHYVQFFRFSLALLRRHLALVGKVGFVAHQHDDHVAAALRSHVIDPFRRLMKWIRVCKGGRE